MNRFLTLTSFSLIVLSVGCGETQSKSQVPSSTPRDVSTLEDALVGRWSRESNQLPDKYYLSNGTVYLTSVDLSNSSELNEFLVNHTVNGELTKWALVSQDNSNRSLTIKETTVTVSTNGVLDREETWIFSSDFNSAIREVGGVGDLPPIRETWNYIGSPPQP